MSPEQRKAFEARFSELKFSTGVLANAFGEVFEAGWNARPDAWHEAVLDACMGKKSYDSINPEKTLRSLIDWHVSNARAPISVEAGELTTDEQIDDRRDAVYTELRKKGWNGSMGGESWDRALYRAALAARPAPQVAQAVPAELVAWIDDYHLRCRRISTAMLSSCRTEQHTVPLCRCTPASTPSPEAAAPTPPEPPPPAPPALTDDQCDALWQKLHKLHGQCAGATITTRTYLARRRKTIRAAFTGEAV